MQSITYPRGTRATRCQLSSWRNRVKWWPTSSVVITKALASKRTNSAGSTRILSFVAISQEGADTELDGHSHDGIWSDGENFQLKKSDTSWDRRPLPPSKKQDTETTGKDIRGDSRTTLARQGCPSRDSTVGSGEPHWRRLMKSPRHPTARRRRDLPTHKWS